MPKRVSATNEGGRTASARVALGALVLLGVSSIAGAARAEPKRATVPAGGGLDAVEIEVDATAGVLRTRRCKALPCGAKRFEEIKLGLGPDRVDPSAIDVRVVAIGEGRSAAIVRVPDRQRKDLAYEAVIAGHADAPVFAGLTGFTAGSEGDRSGTVVLTYDRDASTRFVMVADVREDTRICGQAATPLGARGLDARSMQLRGATLHRLPKKTRDEAARVVAVGRDDATPPLARLLGASGASAPHAARLTDGDPATVWSEARPGDGHGEFVTTRTSSDVPIHALRVVIAPPEPAADGAAPRTLYVATDAATFHVTLPEDAWRKPGRAYDIPLPEPVRTTCVAVVLDEAYANGKAAPVVSIAEMYAVSRFDAEGASLDDVAAALAGERAEEAAGVLKRAGERGLEAVLGAWPKLDARGRALAVDVAAAAGDCAGRGGELLSRALAEADREVRKRAVGRLERCGKGASAALAAAVRSPDEAIRAAAAPLLASVAPSAALAPLSDALGGGGAPTRRAVRAALTRAAASASRGDLLALLSQPERAASARVELLRALGPRLADLRPEADAALAELLRTSPDMATRYLLAQPLARLAAAPDATPGAMRRLADFVRNDPDWPVRARAVELAGPIRALAPAVLAATTDKEPRVREAALRALAGVPGERGTPAAARAALAKDPWTFVRLAAVDALGASGDTSPLALALEDAAPRVRGAAADALGRARAGAYAPALVARATDTREDPDVRASAARALGEMCAPSAIDPLTALARGAAAPADAGAARVAFAAIDGLAALAPRDLDRRLAPLRDPHAPHPVRAAAARALARAAAAGGRCGK
ncbi:MAG: HEAT repeat domain-containing protein [Polyangiaceae bacterium]